MQNSERIRLMNVYRNETSGRIGLFLKCAACIAALALIGSIALSGAGDRPRDGVGDTETPTRSFGAPMEVTQDRWAGFELGAQGAQPLVAP